MDLSSWNAEGYIVAQQLRRASSSIGAQIAEAWGKRRYPRHFVVRLSDADAEQLETRHWLTVAVDRGYVAADQARELMRLLDSIGRMLNGMMRKAHRFKVGSQ